MKCNVSPVVFVFLLTLSVPAAAWLLGSGILGLVGFRRRSA